jgi:hypothetical protein
MKRAFIAIAIMVLPGAAWAQTCQNIGGTTYCSGSNGSSYTGQRIGGTTYWNGTVSTPDGNREPFRKTCQTIGATTYCN